MQTARPIRQIVILGGGTAGWLTAVYLERTLHRIGRGDCRITLIESSDIETVGVGEATLPTLADTFQTCEFDEAEWMRACNASFKASIRFKNWLRQGSQFWHPFDPLMADGSQYDIFNNWLRRRELGDNETFHCCCFPGNHLAIQRKAPKQGDEPDYHSRYNYGYHLDAGRLATYLKTKGKQRGIRHIVDDVVHVEQDERGFLTALRTRHHGSVGGDLFIDCSGFRGALINQVLGEPFESYADCLFCDKALAIPVPTDDERDGINPYTTATALSNGWAWHTPLFGRSGNGYVYSSAFTTSDEAEQEFRSYLGPAADDIDARHLNMRVGKTRNIWVKNCVSIGLSAGFIEPLESTGIALIEYGVQFLAGFFPDTSFSPDLAREYNRLMTRFYEQVRDFIVLHYCLTRRDDTEFWRANRNHATIPDSLQMVLDGWRDVAAPNFDLARWPTVIALYSWFCILAGMERLPKRPMPLFQHLDQSDVDEAFSEMRDELPLLEQYPDHFEYLRQLHAPADDRVPVPAACA